MISRYEGFIFDLDGTVYLGDELIPGAAETLAAIKAQGRKRIFLTNKPIARRSDYAKKLTKLGISCTEDEVINSTYVLARHMARTAPDARLLVIGEEPLIQDLRLAGLTLTDDPTQTDYVVISWDREFHYNKLNAALQAVRRGALTIATNPDRTCPMPGGLEVPDCAGMIGAIEGVTGKKLDLNVGKPSPITLEIALERIGLRADQCLMVGDRIETDVRMGVDAGMDTALVLTGVTKETDLVRYDYRPTHLLRSIHAILVGSQDPVC